MELSQNKFKAIINADCYKVCSEEELNMLNSNYEKFNYNDVKSFATIISQMPTYKTIANRYRIPDECNWNEKNKQEATGLDEIMDIEEIRSIYYYEYVGENIHSAINQEKSWAAGEFDVASGKDIKLVSEKFMKYLFGRVSNTINIELVNEIEALIKLCKIAEKYDKEIWFYDGYHWQY